MYKKLLFIIQSSYGSILLGVLPAIIIIATTLYLLSNGNTQVLEPASLPGKPLAAYDDLYPIGVDSGGRLFLDKERFVQAVDYLTQKNIPRAIADLVYIGQSNNVVLLLSEKEKQRYLVLLDKPDYRYLKKINAHKDSIFEVYKDIVNGIGQTFAHTGIEVVLHDTRNPLQSVVAIQNPISGRRLYDSTTNFGVELIKNYSTANRNGSSYISYSLTLKDGRNIKSSTVPLFSKQYGLIGFICMNIDISGLDNTQSQQAAKFLESFRTVADNQHIDELIENTKHTHKTGG